MEGGAGARARSRHLRSSVVLADADDAIYTHHFGNISFDGVLEKFGDTIWKSMRDVFISNDVFYNTAIIVVAIDFIW